MPDHISCTSEGQVFMDCAPLCPTTCSNMGVASPCPRVCVGGCGCPEGMVISEEDGRCVMPSQCPNQGSYAYTLGLDLHNRQFASYVST